MKSIEFVKQRIKSGFSNVPLQEETKFMELKFDDLLKLYTKEEFQKWFIDNKCQLKYENADFEYFTMERCVCDGILIFIGELIGKVLLKVIQIQTVNNDKMPEDFNRNQFNYDILYTVGNFVICDEYWDFGTDDKPWLYSRFTVMLPIKFEIVKRR